MDAELEILKHWARDAQPTVAVIKEALKINLALLKRA